MPMSFVVESYDAQGRQILGTGGTILAYDIKTLSGLKRRIAMYQWQPQAAVLKIFSWPYSRRYDRSAARLIQSVPISHANPGDPILTYEQWYQMEKARRTKKPYSAATSVRFAKVCPHGKGLRKCKICERADNYKDDGTGRKGYVSPYNLDKAIVTRTPYRNPGKFPRALVTIIERGPHVTGRVWQTAPSLFIATVEDRSKFTDANRYLLIGKYSGKIGADNALKKFLDQSMRPNPGRSRQLIYGRVLEVRAQKTSHPHYKGQFFKHAFSKKSGVIMEGNPDGTITMRSRTGKRLWKPE
jgi:hypothetical protein